MTLFSEEGAVDHQRHRRARLTASVLLATHNRRALLPSVLEPLLNDPAASEIVVVVDGCEDGSLELLRAMADEDPRIKPHFISNRGAARALLAGAREATRSSIRGRSPATSATIPPTRI
jgi:cellulose synthase/poly-beta-1,6-N-acetylglucosamine synthase-like glycosyltransferase